MNVKFLLLSVFVFLFTLAATETSAQAKQRLILKRDRGEAGPAVAGKVRGMITGTEYKDYFFTVPKNRSADISLYKDSGEEVTFDLIMPDGKKLVESVGDMLDDLPQKGTYTIRVYRIKEASKAGKSKFQLTIFMYI